MAAVSAELRFRDGQRQNISVKVENNLRSLINGINELNANVSHLLSQLVEREKDRGACAVGELLQLIIDLLLLLLLGSLEINCTWKEDSRVGGSW